MAPYVYNVIMHRDKGLCGIALKWSVCVVHHEYFEDLKLFNPIELSQIFVNISESSAVSPRLIAKWDMLIFSA